MARGKTTKRKGKGQTGLVFTAPIGAALGVAAGLALSKVKRRDAEKQLKSILARGDRKLTPKERKQLRGIVFRERSIAKALSKAGRASSFLTRQAAKAKRLLKRG